MSNVRMLFAVTAIALTTGCASGLNSYQKAELDHFEAKGLVVEEKSPGTGAALGLLPVAIYLMRGCPACWLMGLLEAVQARKERCGSCRAGGRPD